MSFLFGIILIFAAIIFFCFAVICVCKVGEVIMDFIDDFKDWLYDWRSNK